MHAGIAPREQTPPCTVHAGRYGQQAGSMHPTGMHTCFIFRNLKKVKSESLNRFTFRNKKAIIHCLCLKKVRKHFHLIPQTFLLVSEPLVCQTSTAM